jgi:outer membrane receptor protein involved in Fe transport
MRTCIISCSTLFLFAVEAAGQNFSSVEGTVKDSLQQPLAFTTVSLMNAADSTLVKAGLSDESGTFILEQLKSGDYFLMAYLSGYKKTAIEKFHLNESEKKIITTIVLKHSSANLKEIEVAAQKPFIEHFADKTVVNVENSIVSVGNSVYDVLERSPGVSIDQDENISLRGKTSVNVMIDGKPMQMSADQLASYLKGMQASTVEKIELISNPSSKYDAAGSAGIINIKTKKGRKDGLNSSVYGVYGQGRYEKLNGGFSFNFKHKRFNWFGNYDYAKKRDFFDLNLDRTFYTSDTPTTRYTQHNYVVFPMNVHTAKLGCDFYESPKTTVGFMLNGSSNRFNSYGYSNSETMNGQNELQYYFNTISGSKEARENASANVNFKHDIDTTGKAITADLDYSIYNNPIAQNFSNTYVDPYGNQYSPPTSIRTNEKSNLQIYSAKIDYSHPFSPTLKMEAGVKSSYVTADNDKVFYNTTNGIEVLDTGKTNHFLYNENINAAYLILSKDYKKLSLQFGLRGEQTLVHGDQVTNGIIFNRNYAQLFPSTFALYKLNDNNELSFSYNRRINRPDYQSLNPFILYIDPTFYKQGNPYLDPELSDNFQLIYSFKEILSVAPFYSYNRKTISAVLLQDDVNKITIQTEQNMNHVEYYGINIDASLKPFNWWNSYNDVSVYNGTYNGAQQGQGYERGNTVLSVNSTNSFILPKGFSAELSFFYKTKEIYSILNINPYSSLNAGIKKVFLNKKLVTKVGLTDILYTNRTSGGVQFNTINETFARKRDTQIITFSITYNMGKGGSTAAAKRESGDEDEKKRAASSAG